MRAPIEESQLLEGMSIFLLKSTGLWNAINTYLTTRRRTIGLNILTAYSIFYALPYVLFQLVSMFVIHVNVEKLTFLFLNSFPCIQVFLKVSVFWYRIEEQCDIFTLLKQDFLSCIPPHKMPKVREIYKQWARYSNVACVMAFASMILCMSSWIIVPGIDGVDDTGAVSKKILGGWYPFPFSRPPWNYIVFYYEMLLMSSHGSLISLFECVMIQPLLCLCAHFTVLGHHISTLKISDVVYSKSKNELHYMNSELRAILLDYDRLLRYTAVMQDILNLLVTAILGTGIVILIIGVLQFKFGTLDPMFVFHFLTFLSYQATEVFLICTSSSALHSASSDICFSIYSSDWYLADREYARTAQMIMVRTYKPSTLTAIKMYPVSVEILVGLFQFTYTAAMVLSK
ncbi:odorant receptor 85b [Halyomorpha halys]|uniref:odorant receptor 85b n=1 Tax=Halyomorpha halys TaxID=286706 RepID=UPI0034D203FE|nr:Odorant receptor 34 [Halyomorpha halys]